MNGKGLAVVACVGTVCWASPALAKDNGFGDQGQFILSADRLFSLIAFSDVSQDEPGNATKVTDTYQQWSFATLFGGTPGYTTEGAFSPAAETLYTVPRVGFDYVVRSHLTVGGEIIIYTTLGGNTSKETYLANSTTTTTSGNPTTFAFGLAPRVGYVIPLTDALTFWPRGGVSWGIVTTNDTVGGVNTGASTNQFAIDLDPQLVISPVSHLGFTVGITTDIPVAGGVSVTAGNSSASANSSIFFFGATVGMLGYF